MPNLIDTDAKIIYEREDGFAEHSVIRTSDGRIYIGHINTSGQLEIRYSDNGGTNWSLDTTFSPPSGEGDIDMFSFAISDLDDVFLTYSFATDIDTYTLKVQKRDHSSETWSEVLSETSLVSTGIILKPLITWNRKSGLSRLHIFWLTHASGRSPVYINNKYTDNYGSSWTNGTQRTHATDNYHYTIDSIDSNPLTSDIYLIVRLTNATFRGKMERWNYNGIFQSSADIVSSTNRNLFGHSLVIDNQGNRWIISFREGSGTYYFQVYKNETTFSVDLITSGVSQTYKDMYCIGSDASDNIYAFYTKKSDDKAYYKKYDEETSTWSSEIALSSGDAFRIGCEQHSLVGNNKLHTSYYTD